MLQCRVEQLKAHKANCTLFLLVASPRLRFLCTFVFRAFLKGKVQFGLVEALGTGKQIGKINQESKWQPLGWTGLAGPKHSISAHSLALKLH